MAVSVSRISWWWWGGKEKEPISNGSSMSSLPDWGGFGSREQDNLKFRSAKAAKMPSSSRKARRKWKSREERRGIDKEYDVVLVPSDGVCLSGSESDESDWSIGWLEPHAPDFQSDDEGDDSFAVLVPCYRHDCWDLEEKFNDNSFLSAIKNLPNDYSDECDKNEISLSKGSLGTAVEPVALLPRERKRCTEQWLSSLQNF